MNFIHNGARGDIIYSLPTIIKKGGGEFYFRKKMQFFDLFRLLEIQSYIKKAAYWDRIAKIDLSLDIFEIGSDIREGRSRTHLAQNYLDEFNEEFDLSQPWLDNIEPQHVADITVQRTKRYHDKEEINWQILRPYYKECVFIGDYADYLLFRKLARTDMRWTRCVDMLQMAQIIKGSKILISNQSVAFALAEAMKHPRVLEICYKMDNCRPQSKNGHIYLDTNLLARHLN